MIIDFHAHVHDDGTGQWADAVAEEARRVGIDYVVEYECITHSRENADLVTDCNERCRFTYERHPDIYIPFVYTHPNLGEFAMDEVKKGFDWGCRGIKFEVASVITDKCVEPFVEFAIEHNAPIVQHTWHKITGNLPFETDAWHCAELGRRYPELKLIVAHISGDNRWGIRAIRDVPSLYTDCSGSIADFGHIEYCVEQLGADRLLWGTDIRGADYLYTLAKVRDSSLSDEDKAKVLGLNAAKLLGIEA